MRNTSPWLLAASIIMALGSLDTASAQANGDLGAVQSGTAKASDHKANETGHNRSKEDAGHTLDRSRGIQRDRR